MNLIDKFNNSIQPNLDLYTYNNKTRIGNLQEKTLHKALKDLYGEEQNQEIKIGPYYVDVLNGNDIIEIQTKQFNRLREKLTYLISLNQYNINIVFPVFNSKIIYWINEETGEISKGNKSPKKLKIPQVFYELYKIKSLLKKITVTLVILDIDEYRNLNGYSANKKRGSSCYERIPKQMISIIELKNNNDYLHLLPNLEEPFTSQSLAKATSVSTRYSNLMLNVLVYLGCINIIGKEGKKYLYSKN